MRPTIYLGADHNGFALKSELKKYLETKHYTVKDLGNLKFIKTDDYVDFAKKVCASVKKNKSSMGILICGSGQGMCMAANRIAGIRAAMGYSLATAKRARHDEDSNVLCLPSWHLSSAQGLRVAAGWLTTDFSGLTRHKRRIKKLK